MNLLAITFNDHDSNVAYYDGEFVHYFKSERIKQRKHHLYESIQECLQDVKCLFGVDIEDIDEIGITTSVLFDRHDFNKRFYNTKELCVELDPQNNPLLNYTTKPVYGVEHHYAHAMSTWMLEDKPIETRLVFDGAGDSKGWSLFKSEQLVDYELFQGPSGSIGINMDRTGINLGITGMRFDVSGKLMGLQSYGKINPVYLNFLRQFDIRKINHIFDFRFWEEHMGDPMLAKYFALDWIRTVHEHLGDVLVDYFKTCVSKDETFVYTGGVAQNVIWNTKLKNEFPNIIITPQSADDGLSLGVLEILRKKNNLPPLKIKNFPYCQFDVAPETTPTDETIKTVAKYLSEGKVVAWYQGHGEIGPRALGNRSILMDPRIKDGKKKINGIKNRENYRPFGASVLKEHASEYFEIHFDDDYMLFASKVKNGGLDSITHVDGTCRVQTVDNNNVSFRKLMKEFHELTGCPVLLNTSLNLAGKPLAAYPQTVIELFNSTKIDVAVIGNKIFLK